MPPYVEWSRELGNSRSERPAGWGCSQGSRKSQGPGRGEWEKWAGWDGSTGNEEQREDAIEDGTWIEWLMAWAAGQLVDVHTFGIEAYGWSHRKITELLNCYNGGRDWTQPKMQLWHLGIYSL
jgi:hypothetical protein